jgi:hypothetical protein
MLLRNVGTHVQVHTTSQPRRPTSTTTKITVRKEIRNEVTTFAFHRPSPTKAINYLTSQTWVINNDVCVLGPRRTDKGSLYFKLIFLLTVWASVYLGSLVPSIVSSRWRSEYVASSPRYFFRVTTDFLVWRQVALLLLVSVT